MKLIQTLEVPVHGYWEGGAKSVFHWKIDGSVQRDAKGEYVKIGSYDANHWFHVAVGKTERATLANAQRKLRRTTKVPCTFEIVND